MAHFSFGGNMKNNKNYILELILIFIVTILFNLFINTYIYSFYVHTFLHYKWFN